MASKNEIKKLTPQQEKKNPNLKRLYEHLIERNSTDPEEKLKAEKAFNHSKEKIFAQKARLIPIFKLGDEKALTSIFLSSLVLIDEFRAKIFKEINLKDIGKIHVFTEIQFPNTDNDSKDNKTIPDGLILVVKSGKIVDSALFEMKNKKDLLKEDQINRYLSIADNYGINKLVTVSNQFVTSPNESPLSSINKINKKGNVFHLSWLLIRTHAQMLLYGNGPKIKDSDQINIMEEVVKYMENGSAGIVGSLK